MIFKIEKIKRTHIKDLWRLRNNEQTRKISINNKPIQLNDHFIWFNKINQNKTKIFIAIDKKNNSNWMDILRIAFKNSPDESAKIMGDLYF